MKICISCGNDYEYDCNRPLGASSERCSRCRKKQSILNKKIELLNIASNNNPKCFKCGYRNPTGLILIDGVLPLIKPRNETQLKLQAKRQFVLCLNCNSELQNNLIEIKVIDVSIQPIKVEIYEVKVEVVRQKLSTSINYKDGSEIEIEIVKDSAEPNFAIYSPKRIV